jgi:SulP family sulfate permease
MSGIRIPYNDDYSDTLDSIPNNSKVIIDCTNSKSIALDVIELILNFESNAKTKNITVEKVNFKP